MKILLTGESGMLGSAIYNKLKHATAAYQFIDTSDLIKFINQFHYYNHKLVKQPEWDITVLSNYEKLMSIVDSDTVIVHTAAYVNTDKCDDEPYQSVKSNVLGTQMLVQLAKNCQCGFINFSTTAVFDPDTYMKSGGIFTEDCIIDPKTLYGLTKYNAELAVKQALPDTITIKPVFIYGDAPYDNSSNIRKIIDRMLSDTATTPLDITLDKYIKKNYMRVEFFAQMFNEIIRFYDDCKGMDFILSRDPMFGKQFGYYLEDIEKVTSKTITTKEVVCYPENDYLKAHLGYSMNFYRQFPNFNYQGDIKNDIAGITKTYQSVLKLKNG